jgi:TRAP-type mannitol/chloroaromatic compound transport system substrate-binding protein
VYRYIRVTQPDGSVVGAVEAGTLGAAWASGYFHSGKQSAPADGGGGGSEAPQRVLSRR